MAAPRSILINAAILMSRRLANGNATAGEAVKAWKAAGKPTDIRAASGPVPIVITMLVYEWVSVLATTKAATPQRSDLLAKLAAIILAASDQCPNWQGQSMPSAGENVVHLDAKMRAAGERPEELPL